MRTPHLATLAAAATAAGALALGVPAAPTHAAAWKTLTPLQFPAGTITEVDVVATGDGDAVAAAIIDGEVHAAVATDGTWAAAKKVRSNVDPDHLVLGAGANGDVVVGWVEEDVNGFDRLRYGRQTGPATWLTSADFATPPKTDVVSIDLDVSGNGTAISVATVNGEGYNDGVVATEWPKGGSVTEPETLITSKGYGPSIDVNAKGAALVAYKNSGLINHAVSVERRTPGGDWTYAGVTKTLGTKIAATPDVALSDNGQGQVIYSSLLNGHYRAETSRVKPDGTVLAAKLVGAADEDVYGVSVDINSSGKALFAWQAVAGGNAKVRVADAANKAFPTTSSVLVNTGADWVLPLAAITDDGRRAVQYLRGEKVVTYQSHAPGAAFQPTELTGGYTKHSLDTDPAGNLVVAGIKNNTVQARFYDASAPVVALENLPASSFGPSSVALKWTMSDSLSTIVGTDVYGSSSAWNQASTGIPSLIQNLVGSTSTEVPVSPGTTYCFQVRPSDNAGNSSSSQTRCTTVPLDDRKLVGKGWTRADGGGHFLDTVSRTSTKGKTLVRKGVNARRLALVVNKTKKSGKVEVTFQGKSLGTFSLKGKGKRKVIDVATFPKVRKGAVKITVTSKGKPVAIDGLVVAK